jgi:hypothetical protein
MDPALRDQIAHLLDWEDAHASFDRAVAGLPETARGRTPAGLPYSPWQLLEHLRIAQRDILEFCRSTHYQELSWPDDYWPKAAAPPTPGAWEASIRSFREDRAALQGMARDPAVDLTAPVPNGTGQTYLRELLLAADHAAYHVDELIVARRLLGVWP